MSDKVYIYALKEENTDEVRYVGKSVCPEIRFRDHMAAPNCNYKTYTQEWITEVLSRGKKVVMLIIDECEPEQVKEVERRWIRHYHDSNHKITNTVGIKNKFYVNKHILSNPNWGKGKEY